MTYLALSRFQFLLWLMLCFSTSSVLCQVADFDVAPNICLNGKIKVDNNSTGAVSYQWDFCHDALRNPQTPHPITTLSDIVLPYSLEIVEDNGNWYGLVASFTTNKIYRLAFGNDLNSIPVPTEISSTGGGQVKIFKQGSDWIGIAVDAYGQFRRLVFGNSLASTPTVENLGDLTFNIQGLEVVQDGPNWFVFLADYGNDLIRVFDFGNSLLNTPAPAALATFGAGNPLVSGPIRLEIIKIGSTWFGLLNTLDNAKLLRLNFGSVLNSEPVITEVRGIVNPSGLALVNDGENYFGFVSRSDGNLFRFDFGSTLSSTPVVTDIGTYSGAIQVAYAFTVIKKGTGWRMFLHGFYNRALSRIDFQDQCNDVSILSSDDFEPGTFTYTSAGIKTIDLIAYAADGTASHIRKQIEVSPEQAPVVSFFNEGSCIGAPVAFTATSTAGVNSWGWDFGDGVITDPSTPIVSHTYNSSGPKQVILSVTANTGCTNFVSQQIRIFNAPVVNFELPVVSGKSCTNQEYLFPNNTVADAGSLPSWAWQIDGITSSTDADLFRSFSALGSHTVKLVASIPGCVSEIQKVFFLEEQGSLVDFDVEGGCEQSVVSFTNNTVSPANVFEWSFGDTQTSDLENPQHVFTSPGPYFVELKVINGNCVNNKIETLIIHPNPKPDFAVEAPPSSCSGSPTAFTDLSTSLDGILTQWQWNFNNGDLVNVQNPTYTFIGPGAQNVELQVTTSYGCTGAISKMVNILESPLVDFSFNPACLNKTVGFTSSVSNARQYYWEIGASYYESQNINHTFSVVGTHPVRLTVVGENDCVTTVSKDIDVPQPIVPSFTVNNNCKDFLTKFTSRTPGSDPVVSTLWNFGSEGNSTDANPTFKFSTMGNKQVSLQVTTSSGCTYQRQELISILEPPQPNFSFTPDFGVPPQEISFTNQSSNATSYSWSFGDGALSNQPSPKHTFTDLGTFAVELRASNAASCEQSIIKNVPMVAPLPDVDLSLMTLSTNADGTLKVIITIANKGNTILRNLPVKLDVSGDVTLESIVSENILPFSMYNLVLNYSIAQTRNLEFLCASALLEGDLHPEGNRICNPLKSEVAFIAPYPNPAVDFLTVEWVAQDSEAIDLRIIDSKGQTVLESKEVSTAGLNRRSVDLKNVHAGVYILKVVSASGSQTHRILVSN